MKSPQLEEGYTRTANSIQDALCCTNFGGYERQVFDAIVRKTWGFQKKEDKIPNSQLVKMTGLHKAHVSRALKSLIFRKLVTKNGNKLSIQKDYSLWIKEKLPKMVTITKLPKMVTIVTKNGNKKLPKMADSKESKEKRNNVSRTPEEITYYGELIAKELKDQKSQKFYEGACRLIDPHILLQKAKAIIKDGGAKSPGAVFTSWYLEEAKKLPIIKSM